MELDQKSILRQHAASSFFLASLQQSFGYGGDSAAWAASTDIASVRNALSLSVETHVQAPVGCVRVERKRKGFEITPNFSIVSLWEALQWMIWLDEWNGWPPPACLECHRIFPQLTAHERKYCSQKCAHRATNREWRRKDLRQRKKKHKANADGGTVALVKRGKMWHTHFFVDGIRSGNRSKRAIGGRPRRKRRNSLPKRLKAISTLRVRVSPSCPLRKLPRTTSMGANWN